MALIAELKKLAGAWPWFVATFAVGLLLGLVVRLPILPAPNDFTATLWAAIGGSAAAAALTIIGTFHVSLKLKEHEWQAAGRAINDATLKTRAHALAILDHVGDFPKNEDGRFDRNAYKELTPNQWGLLFTASSSSRLAVDAASRDIALFKASTIGLDTSRRLAVNQIERLIEMMGGLSNDLSVLSEKGRSYHTASNIKGVFVELARVVAEDLGKECKTLLSGKKY